MRNINIFYYLIGNENVTFNLNVETTADYTSKTITYDIKDYDEVELYNKMLDDFDAEFDDEIANGLNVLTRQVYKELKKRGVK